LAGVSGLNGLFVISWFIFKSLKGVQKIDEWHLPATHHTPKAQSA
jgi:hypothetical protein